MWHSKNFNDFYLVLILSIVIAFILLLMTPIANASQHSVDPFVAPSQIQLLNSHSVVDVEMA